MSCLRHLTKNSRLSHGIKYYFSLLTSIDGMIEDNDEKEIDLKDFFLYMMKSLI